MKTYEYKIDGVDRMETASFTKENDAYRHMGYLAKKHKAKVWIFDPDGTVGTWDAPFDESERGPYRSRIAESMGFPEIEE